LNGQLSQWFAVNNAKNDNFTFPSFCQTCGQLRTPTAFAGVWLLPPFVCVPGKSSLTSKGQGHELHKHCRRGFVHYCECCLLL